MNKKRLLLPANAARTQIAALKLSMASLSGSPGLNAQIPDDDPDLIETWKHSLNECFELDCQHVQKILDEAQFAGSIIELSITQTDSLLRVCSAIRLKINERYLTESPEIFEGTDDFILDQLNEATDQAIIMDEHLANLQDLLLNQLSKM